MEKTSVPFAISGIARPDKIRALVYANNQVAHAALSEILKAAVPGGETDTGRHMQLPDRTIIQFGHRDQFDRNGYATIALPVHFQNAQFIPLVVPYGDLGRNGTPGAAVDSNRISRAGFGVRIFSLDGAAAPPSGGGVYWLAIGR